MPREPVEPNIVAMRCGTCGHRHLPGMACECGCVFFIAHERDLASIDELETRELAEFPDGPPLLTPAIARALLEALAVWEAGSYDLFPGRLPEPVVAVIGLSLTRASYMTAETDHQAFTTTVLPLGMPRRFWKKRGNPVDALETLSHRVVRDRDFLRAMLTSCGGDPDMGIFGWLYLDDEQVVAVRGQEASPCSLRLLAACDVDGRQYDIQRVCEDGGRRTVRVYPPLEFRRVVREQMVRRLGFAPARPLPRVNEAVERLALASGQDLRYHQPPGHDPQD